MRAAQVANAGQEADDTAATAGHITRLVQLAQAAGQSSLKLAATEPMPTGITTVEKVVAAYSVIVAQPLSHETVIDGPSLVTWYKVKVVDYLLKQKAISTDPLPRSVPQMLTTLRSNEVLVPISGGELTIHNLPVRQPNPHHFVLKEKSSYVLIALLECSGAVADLAADSASVYVKNADDTFVALSDRPSQLANDLHDRYLNLFSLMRSDLLNRARPR